MGNRETLDQVANDYEAQIEDLENQRDAALDRVAEAEKAVAAFNADVYLLAEAISEGRKQDALDIIIDATGVTIPTAKAWANLFPNRVVS